VGARERVARQVSQGAGLRTKAHTPEERASRTPRNGRRSRHSRPWDHAWGAALRPSQSATYTCVTQSVTNCPSRCTLTPRPPCCAVVHSAPGGAAVLGVGSGGGRPGGRASPNATTAQHSAAATEQRGRAPVQSRGRILTRQPPLSPPVQETLRPSQAQEQPQRCPCQASATRVNHRP
jgi:hypothetical protein